MIIKFTTYLSTKIKIENKQGKKDDGSREIRQKIAENSHFFFNEDFLKSTKMKIKNNQVNFHDG